MHKFLHKVYTKCAKLVDEKNYQMVCCVNSVSVHDFEPQILIKGVHLSNFEKVDFFLMKKGIHIMNPKKQKKRICHHTPFYSIFNMSSCRKPEIQNDLPKIT